MKRLVLVLPQPLGGEAAEVGVVDEPLLGDLVGDVDHLLVRRVEAEAVHRHMEILGDTLIQGWVDINLFKENQAKLI